MSDVARLRAAAAWQAVNCRLLGSPTWATVIEHLSDELDGAHDAARLLREDAGDPQGTMVWLRFLGAVHRLVLDDPSCALAEHFPTTGGTSNPPAAAVGVLHFVDAHADAVAREMVQPVQTNEVARAAPLSAAMGWLGGDLHLLEIGASAGLNLWLDRYRVVGPTFSWGPADSPVVLDARFGEGVPTRSPFRVLDRRGCDLAPRDVTNAADRRLLRSFMWPDQADRLARLDAAMSLAGPTTLDRADASAWTREQLQELAPGRTVVFHSIVLLYFSDDEQAALEEILLAAGHRADRDAALAHVSMELAGNDAELVVRRWPERDAYRLAVVSPHGTNMRWQVEPRPLTR